MSSDLIGFKVLDVYDRVLQQKRSNIYSSSKLKFDSDY